MPYDINNIIFYTVNTTTEFTNIHERLLLHFSSEKISINSYINANFNEFKKTTRTKIYELLITKQLTICIKNNKIILNPSGWLLTFRSSSILALDESKNSSQKTNPVNSVVKVNETEKNYNSQKNTKSMKKSDDTNVNTNTKTTLYYVIEKHSSVKKWIKSLDRDVEVEYFKNKLEYASIKITKKEIKQIMKWKWTSTKDVNKIKSKIVEKKEKIETQKIINSMNKKLLEENINLKNYNQQLILNNSNNQKSYNNFKPTSIQQSELANLNQMAHQMQSVMESYKELQKATFDMQNSFSTSN